MPSKTKIACCFLGGLIYVPVIFGQYKFEKPVVIAEDQGLPSTDIRSFKKGGDGFIWIGTADGLSRFDGQRVKTFNLTDNLDLPPFTNSINSIQPSDDKIWIGTDQGISVMNCKDYTFKHYQLSDKGKADSLKKRIDQHVAVLFLDKENTLWVGTRNRGVCRYDAAKDDFRFFSFSRKEFPALFPTVGSDNAVLSLEASRDNDSIIWAGTPGGLQEINKYNGHVSLYSFPQKNKDYQVALNAFRRLYYHDDGLLYVGSWAAGVNVFDPINKTFTPLPIKNEMGKKILNTAVSRIYRKSDHEMWISSIAGLVIYDSKLKDVTWYKINNVTKNEFYAIDFIDEANRAWHNDVNGLQYFDPAMQQFAHYSFTQLSGGDWGYVFYLLPDKTGNNITVCPRLTDGLYRFNLLRKEWTKFSFPADESFKAEKDAIRGFAELPSGDFIITADKGIFSYSEKTKQITSLQKRLPFNITRGGEVILDHLGNLWVSDDARGLIKWKPGSATYRLYKTNIVGVDTTALPGRVINLMEDSRGNIWFKRASGFGVYVAKKDSIANFLYTIDERTSFPDVHSLIEDKNGKVWINDDDGSIGYALSEDPEKGIVRKVSTNNKVKPAYLPSLAADSHGNIWGYTSKELFKINADDLQFTTYSFSYGIGNVDFFHFSFLPSGEMIFGGRNDIIIADPSELRRNTEIPVPYVDELEVLNHPFKFNVNGSPLRLTYKQNFFSIRFSALAYTMPNDVKYRYRLKGFDNWTEVTGRHFANYTNVPGGDYVFQLQAANNEGVWNKSMLELPIHVSTSFWRSWLFLSGIILLTAAAAYWFYRFRIDQLKKKQRMKLEYEKKLANVEMTALLAQMNPHFLFNCLNSIDSYIIRNESKKASEYLNNFARLMRLILQNSRSNHISLKDELEALDLYLQMERLRFTERFEYEIKVEKGADAASIVIPPMLIQPYVENAIWHGLMHKKDGTTGKVEIIISREDSQLVCIVKDNGIGRAKAEEIKALKPGNRKRSMGMQITSDRIEMINKLYNANTTVRILDMSDESGNATGTRVELIIPV